MKDMSSLQRRELSKLVLNPVIDRIGIDLGNQKALLTFEELLTHQEEAAPPTATGKKQITKIPKEIKLKALEAIG